ncbi:MAG: alpha/beta hydrolase [Gaiella sp.]
MIDGFTPSHRGGSGEPLVCLHGFLETWRTWELVLPRLERRHEVFAPTLPGHAGGPELPRSDDATAFLDRTERLLDDAGIDTAHLVGASLGGYLALQLAARGRARSVVAFAPAGGWAIGDPAAAKLFETQRSVFELACAVAPSADALATSAAGRRAVTALVVERGERLPPALVAHQIRAAAGCSGALRLLASARTTTWAVDAARIACPVRIVWGAADLLLPWPDAATRYRSDWLPHADWVVLDGVGHSPHLDVPLEAAELILGWCAPVSDRGPTPPVRPTGARLYAPARSANFA